MKGPAELDPPEVEAWLDAVSGRLAFDVGANTGRVASRLALRFEKVLAFEPAFESFAFLRQVALRQPNIVALCTAVSDHDGLVLLSEQASSLKTGQLTTPGGGGEGWAEELASGGGGWGDIVGSRECAAMTLDSVAALYGDPDFVKIDIEGHEVLAVEGGLALFERARPRFYIEVHNRSLGERITELLSPLYPALREIRHPYYKPSDFGAENHYWLVSS